MTTRLGTAVQSLPPPTAIARGGEPVSQPNMQIVTEQGRRTRWMTIGEVAREFGLTLRALRFYESKGLIAPLRDGSHRL
jgi:hypothetical protein